MFGSGAKLGSAIPGIDSRGNIQGVQRRWGFSGQCFHFFFFALLLLYLTLAIFYLT